MKYFAQLIAIMAFLFNSLFAQEAYLGSGNWLELNGVNGYAAASSSGSLQLGKFDFVNLLEEDFTIECFFEIPNTNVYGGLISKHKSYQLRIWGFYDGTNFQGSIFLEIWPDNLDIPIFLEHDVILSLGWHHVAASFDNSGNDQAHIYLDGKRVAFSVEDAFYTVDVNDYELNVGRYNVDDYNDASDFRYFNGRIDEVRLSDIIRYEDTYIVPTSDFTVDSHTRALWHFSEVVGSTSFSDATTNNNVLTGYNGAEALPVELTTFTATVQKTNVQLLWQTVTEINNYGFEIERQHVSTLLSESNNFIPSGVEKWKTLGFVEGHGNSNSQKHYLFTDNSLTVCGKYFYRLKQIDIDGKYEYSAIIEVNVGVPEKFELRQNFPNPFNPITTIQYSIPVPNAKFTSITNVLLKVYDVLGKEVATLVNEEKQAGSYEVNFDGSNLSSGIYIYRLEADNFIDTKKLVLLK